MPFPFKKKSDDIPAPEPMEGMRKQSAMSKMSGMGGKSMIGKEPMPEMGEEHAESGDLGALGEKYGLSPDETKALAKEIMGHFMGMCGRGPSEEAGEGAGEPDYEDAEKYEA
jgi:hypothetical protein